MKVIVPPSTIGIIGGGQLGQMIAQSAKAMGYRLVILDPSEDACARSYSNEFICASFDDEAALEQLCSKSDVVTFEFENVNVDILERLSKKYYFAQDIELLRLSQHRVLEKQLANRLNIPTVDYVAVAEEIPNVNDFPYLMKTLRLGYDGKGQKMIYANEEIEPHTILEKCVALDQEISVVACRSIDGIKIIGIIENEHRNNILYRSFIPANVSEALKQQAIDYTLRILESFNYYGVLTVEYFVVDHQLLFNEIAPRVHNSGHITMESNNVSQFDAHVKAICGRVIGEITTQPYTMYNILGQDLDYYLNFIQKNAGFIHLYGKQPRHNRKIGHINFSGRVIYE